MQACQGTPKFVSLGSAAKAAAKWLGRRSHWWASPSLGQAAKGHPTALGSPWVSQRQMLEDEHSAKQKATINISVCSQMPLSWLLMRKFTVRKAIVLTKMCASKCLQKATRGGQANSKGRVPWNRVDFEEHHRFLWVCLLLIWLHWTSSHCGGVAPRCPAANSLFPEMWGAGDKEMALSPWSPRMWCHMRSPWDGEDLFPSCVLLPRCLKLKAAGQIQCVSRSASDFKKSWMHMELWQIQPCCLLAPYTAGEICWLLQQLQTTMGLRDKERNSGKILPVPSTSGTQNHESHVFLMFSFIGD